jgi:hypothetical protein
MGGHEKLGVALERPFDGPYVSQLGLERGVKFEHGNRRSSRSAGGAYSSEDES